MKQTESIEISRRRLFAMAGLSAGATLLARSPLFADELQPLSSKVNPADVPPIKPGTNTPFRSLKQINAGVLNIGYAEAGPANGPAVILLHGWPYDIHSYVDVPAQLGKIGNTTPLPRNNQWQDFRIRARKSCREKGKAFQYSNAAPERTLQLVKANA
jgi:hypothetical protein